jgi:hypothetical protein
MAVGERIVGRPARAVLAELKVVGDDLGAVGGDPLDRAGVQGAGKGIFRVQLVEGGVVDPHDDQVVRRCSLPADREARIDRVSLETSQDVAGVGEHRERRDHQSDAREERDSR